MDCRSALRLLPLLFVLGLLARQTTAQERRNTASTWLDIGFGLSTLEKGDQNAALGGSLSVNRRLSGALFAQAAFHLDHEMDWFGLDAQYTYVGNVGLGLASGGRAGRLAAAAGPGITRRKELALVVDVQTVLPLGRSFGIGLEGHANFNRLNDVYAARLLFAFTLR